MLTTLATLSGEECGGDGLGGRIGTRFISHDITHEITNGDFGIDLDCRVA